MDLTPADAASRIESGAAELVDVREPYEWEAGRIEGARHVPIPELAALAEELDPERPVVFVCRVGARSAMAADAFRKGGYEAYSLAGGLEAWAGDGRSLEPEDGSVASH